MDKTKGFFETAVILAGGKSSRMGFDKQLLKREDQTLAALLADALLKDFSQVIVVTKTKELYEGLPVKTTKDIYPGLGPMSGIHAAFGSCQSERIFVMACDMTVYDPGYARYQAERMLQDGTLACVTRHGEKLENFHGFYDRRLLSDMEQMLRENRTSIYRFLNSHPVTIVEEKELSVFTTADALFRNLNTKEDYERYLKEFQ